MKQMHMLNRVMPSSIRGRLILCLCLALLLHIAIIFFLYEWDVKHSIWCLLLSFMYCAGVMLAIFYIVNSMIHRFEMLADAAAAFGNSPSKDQKKMPDQGPLEIRKTIHAFNTMQRQIQNLLHERDDMYTAIAHDIRTPLARIQMSAEDIGESSIQEGIIKNIAAISAIVEKGMSLTKSGLSAEEQRAIDLVSFVEEIAEQFSEASPEVKFMQVSDAAGRICVMARCSGLAICLRNLIANGIAYGNGHVAICVTATDEAACVNVEDNGPGIPDCCLEKVFRPFVRMESSCNGSSGGMGLGLSIARNAAALDMGKIKLENRKEGGLRAQLTLPRLKCDI